MKAPWHLWAIGILSLLWNAGGAFDYLMTQLGNEAYMAKMNEAQLNYILGVPTWFKATWATGVWFSVLGSVLLLFRSRLASVAFGMSILGLIASSVYSYYLADPSALDVVGPVGAGMSVAIVVVLVLLWIYARAMTRRGVLR